MLAGQIHALVGENGAGKSTLVKIAAGVYRPDGGTIYVRDRPVSFTCPADSLRQGIAVVHQQFMLVPALTVLENVLLGLPKAGVWLRPQNAARKLARLSGEHGLLVEPDAYVWQLPAGLQQRVEILKALYRDAEILILDEPTSVLTPQEASSLFRLLRSLAARGLAVVFISHKLDEVVEIGDLVTVMRKGRVVATLPPSEATVTSLASLMLDTVPPQSLPEMVRAPGPVACRVEDLVLRGFEAVRGISLSLRQAEILSLIGVDGNGQRELAECIVGLQPGVSGRIRLSSPVGQGGPGSRGVQTPVRIGYIPENRDVMGLIPGFSVTENLFLRSFHAPPFSRNGLLTPAAASASAWELLRDHDIRVPSSDVPAAVLSGGTRQKVILARELSNDPSVLVASHPTRGLDVGAAAYVRDRLSEQRERGTAVLLITADLHEALTLGDRVAVIFRGQIMGIARRGEFSREHIGLMMGGVRLEAQATDSVDQQYP